jgi:hypothetical protein
MALKDQELLEILKDSHPDTLIRFIKAEMAFHELTQHKLSKRVGINRTILNLYLNRHIDLKPDDILRIIKELKLQEKLESLRIVLSAPLNFVK